MGVAVRRHRLVLDAGGVCVERHDRRTAVPHGVSAVGASVDSRDAGQWRYSGRCGGGCSQSAGFIAVGGALRNAGVLRCAGCDVGLSFHHRRRRRIE